MNNNIWEKNIDSEYVARTLKNEISIDENIAIDLETLLGKLNITITFREISPVVLGACKSKGLKRLIVINPNINNEGRERFTIAHEIGHLIMHHGTKYCNQVDFNIFLTKNDIEKQANAFATELLLPKFKLKKVLSSNDITIDLIQNVSKQYRTSLISAAIRLISICDYPVAVFYHKNKKIIWGIKSTECKYEIEKSILNHTSIASNFNHENIINKGYVDIESWFTTNSNNIRCFEETIYFKNLGSYLTIARIEDDEY